jgi:hypothetical protein
MEIGLSVQTAEGAAVERSGAAEVAAEVAAEGAAEGAAPPPSAAAVDGTSRPPAAPLRPIAAAASTADPQALAVGPVPSADADAAQRPPPTAHPTGGAATEPAEEWEGREEQPHGEPTGSSTGSPTGSLKEGSVVVAATETASRSHRPIKNQQKKKCASPSQFFSNTSSA